MRKNYICIYTLTGKKTDHLILLKFFILLKSLNNDNSVKTHRIVMKRSSNYNLNLLLNNHKTKIERQQIFYKMLKILFEKWGKNFFI